MHFIIDGNLSFNVTQLPSLQDLLETVSGRKILVPSRHKILKTLNEEYNEIKVVLEEVLARQRYLCSTADVWSSRAQSYLGVTVHFLNRETFKRVSFLLAFKQLHCKQTYKELAKVINDIFKDYGIKTSQITNIVTDGGSAFCKMFKAYGSPVDVSTHTEELNDSEEDFGDVNADAEPIDTITNFMEDINGEQFVNEVLLFESDISTDAYPTDEIGHSSNTNSENSSESYFGGSITSEINDQIEMPPQRRCISHICHLASQDFENKCLTGLAKVTLCQSLSKLHILFVITRRSSRAKTICKSILKQCLKLPCETRWNSRYDAVKMCTQPEIQKNLNKLFQALKTEINCHSAQNLQQHKDNFSVWMFNLN